MLHGVISNESALTEWDSGEYCVALGQSVDSDCEMGQSNVYGCNILITGCGKETWWFL
jgi:hypothetical protein